MSPSGGRRLRHIKIDKIRRRLAGGRNTACTSAKENDMKEDTLLKKNYKQMLSFLEELWTADGGVQFLRENNERFARILEDANAALAADKDGKLSAEAAQQLFKRLAPDGEPDITSSPWLKDPRGEILRASDKETGCLVTLFHDDGHWGCTISRLGFALAYVPASSGLQTPGAALAAMVDALKETK